MDIIYRMYYLSIYLSIYLSTAGSLEVKLPTIWTNGKAEVGRVKEEKKRSEKIREEKEREERRCRCAERYRKVAIHCAFPLISGSGGSNVGSLKRQVRSQLAR